MKLWSAVMTCSKNGEEGQRLLIEFVKVIREVGHGVMIGRREEAMAIFFAVKDDETDAYVLQGMWERFKAARGASEYVAFDRIDTDGRVSSVATYWGVNAGGLQEMCNACREHERESEKMALELTVSVEGIEEAVKLLKVLEAQLHGVMYQTERIKAAIDSLQLQLQNKIEGFSRPDR